MIGPHPVPTERLLKNLTEFTKTHPTDADGFYALGRIQYTLYCENDPRTVGLYSDTPPLTFPSVHVAPFDPQGKTLPNDPKTCRLVADAVANLKKAIALDKGRAPGLYYLTLACVYEAAAPIADKVPLKDARKKALDAYLAAYDGARAGDLTQKTSKVPLTWESWISVEAGNAILQLAPKHPRAAEILAHQKAVAALPPGPITPLIFSLSHSQPLESLLAPDKTVTFNLDGTGTPQRWPWVQPETAFLVWQPDGHSPIRSGRQLFGSATWWLMFKDAYAALEALDNNGDGWLTGSELAGLAVWRDQNQNGVCEAGEVAPLSAVGVTGLATRATQQLGHSLANPAGLRLRDGRILPTYDWVTAPASPNEGSGAVSRSAREAPAPVPLASLGD